MNLSLRLLLNEVAAESEPGAYDIAILILKDAAAIIGPLLGLLGLIGVIYTARQNRKTGKEGVEVSEKDANTRAVSALTEMFTEGLTELRQELKDTKEELARYKAQAATMSAALRDLESKDRRTQARIEILENERVLFLSHMNYLESLIPNPPGAPPRPEFPGVAPEFKP